MHPVLIIGGGPSGLATALTLTQNGVPVRVIDKATSYHRLSRGAGLQPRTMEVFRFLGMLDDVRHHGCKSIQIRSFMLPNTTEPIGTSWMLEPFQRTPDRLEIMCQYITEDIFREHLAKRGVYTEPGTDPASLEQASEVITVVVKKVASGGSEDTEAIRAPYVVGADGAKGFTRRAVGISYEGETKELDGQVWVDIELERITSEWNVWTEPEKFTTKFRSSPSIRRAGVCELRQREDGSPRARFQEIHVVELLEAEGHDGQKVLRRSRVHRWRCRA